MPLLSKVQKRIEKIELLEKDIFDQIGDEDEKKPIKVELLEKDIFDDIEDDVRKSGELNEKVLRKEFVPPKKVALSHEIVELIKREMDFKGPSKIVERVVEEVKQEKIEQIVGKAISKVMDDLQAKELSQLRELRKEYEKLREEISNVKKEPKTSGIIVRAGFPNTSGQTGKFLTNDGQKTTWGQVYGSDDTPIIPLGNQDTNGSWRIRINGNDLVFERLESGSWSEKGAYFV